MTQAVPAAVSQLSLRRRRRASAMLAGLAALLLVGWLLGVGVGAVAIAPGQVLSILVDPLGIALPWDYDAREAMVLSAIRLPRACLALLVGAALAVSGAALQGLFRNPLADPGLIGVSTGAALAAVTVIVLGAELTAALPGIAINGLLPPAAFVGGLLATLLVYRIASWDGRTDVATLLLAGVALNAIAAAGIGFLVFISTDQQLRDLNFWLLGSLAGAGWGGVLSAAPWILLPTFVLPILARHLNALLLGEGEAFHLGFDVERAKRLIVVLVALAVGASVALTGVIGFVGLVVPHLVRLMIGPDHRILLPATILLGAALLLVTDLLARTLVLPAELPIGVLTSAVGGPFFLWLLMRRRVSGVW